MSSVRLLLLHVEHVVDVYDSEQILLGVDYGQRVSVVFAEKLNAHFLIVGRPQRDKCTVRMSVTFESRGASRNSESARRRSTAALIRHIDHVQRFGVAARAGGYDQEPAAPSNRRAR